MKTAARISALLVFVGLVGYSTLAAAQDAPPPPPPPPPSSGPEATPPPAADPAPPVADPNAAPPTTAPAPNQYRCGVPYAPPCHAPPPQYYRPRRFWRLGLYLGAGAGGFGIMGAKGPYQYISAGGFGSVWMGLNFSRRFALELGFIGSMHNEQFSGYDGYSYSDNNLTLWGVTLDAKFNLVQPGWRSRFVPYLQAGVGAYGLVGDYYDGNGYVGFQSLATGGGVQLGGGLDIYLARWLVLGARVLYRGIILGELKCNSGGDRCVSSDTETRTVLHGITGELNMSIVF
jgi:hypothetical protein